MSSIYLYKLEGDDYFGNDYIIVAVWKYDEIFEENESPHDDFLRCLLCEENIIHFVAQRNSSEKYPLRLKNHFREKHPGVMAFAALNGYDLEQTTAKELKKMLEEGECREVKLND